MKKLNWDEYFVALTKISEMRSKDPNTRVGAVLVDKDKRVIGTGYNGMPLGNDNFPWKREGKTMETKYPYVIHAEINAILNTTSSPKGSSLYVSLFPCSNCAKTVTQAGVKEIIYTDDKYKDTEDDKIAKKIFNDSGVKYRKVTDLEIAVNKK